MTAYKINDNLTIRPAVAEETGIILQFIQELAAYEKMEDYVQATEELIAYNIFDRKLAEVLFCVYNNEIVGFALFFHNFSTFVGKPGIYLEDLYVRKEYRGKGIGRALIRTLGRIAAERDCGRVEWSCLNWNKKSIQFYLNSGAVPMKDWTVYRLTEDKFRKMPE